MLEARARLCRVALPGDSASVGFVCRVASCCDRAVYHVADYPHQSCVERASHARIHEVAAGRDRLRVVESLCFDPGRGIVSVNWKAVRFRGILGESQFDPGSRGNHCHQNCACLVRRSEVGFPGYWGYARDIDSCPGDYRKACDYFERKADPRYAAGYCLLADHDYHVRGNLDDRGVLHFPIRDLPCRG